MSDAPSVLQTQVAPWQATQTGSSAETLETSEYSPYYAYSGYGAPQAGAAK